MFHERISLQKELEVYAAWPLNTFLHMILTQAPKGRI